MSNNVFQFFLRDSYPDFGSIHVLPSCPLSSPRIFVLIYCYDGVITDLDPDILECEVKWALESITTNKASVGDGILAELFHILKDDAVKVLHSICQQIWKFPGLEKVSFHSNPQGRQCQRMLKLPHNCTHLTGLAK